MWRASVKISAEATDGSRRLDNRDQRPDGSGAPQLEAGYMLRSGLGARAINTTGT